MILYFKEPHVVCEPETTQEYEKLISIFREKLEPSKIDQGRWFFHKSHTEELSKLLIPFRSNLKQHNTFKDYIRIFREEHSASASIKFIVGINTSRIIGRAVDIPTSKIEEVTRYFFKGAVNSEKYKSGKWDGYIVLYKKRDHTFPTGLLERVLEVFNSEKKKYTIEYCEDMSFQKQYLWKVCDNLIPDQDQIEAIEAALKNKRGIIKAPTGFGKTALLAKGIVAGFGVPTLFIANRKSLLDDASEEFSRGIVEESTGKHPLCLPVKDSMFGSIKLPLKEKAPVNALQSEIVVGTVQSIAARLKDENTKDAMLDFLQNKCKLVIIDELQAIGTDMWNDVLNSCKAPLRFGLSATPRRTDGGTILLSAQTGEIIYSTTAETQIEKGRLCELEIYYNVFDHQIYNDEDSGLVYSDAYKTFIVENEKRNKEAIVNPAMEMVAEGRFVLVLIQLIEHGQILLKMFEEAGLSASDVRFIWGETPNKIRQSAVAEFKKGAFKVLIGSTIFDAGVNIPIISGVVLGGAGNSDITLIQRIGRGARNADYEDLLGFLPDFMKNADRKVTKVYDILDKNIKFFHKQSRNRYYNVISEFGKDRVHIKNGDKSSLRKTPKIKNPQNIDVEAAKKKLMEMFKKDTP